MPSTKPSVAVLGCGRWGMQHVRTWWELGCLAVACDLDPVRRALVRERHPGVEVCDRPEDVLARSDIDGVVIATPAVTHGDLTGAALAAGKDVLVEKPMATDLAEAETLVEAAERGSRVLMVGHVLEYHPAVARLRELVDEGVLGRLLYAYSNRLNFGQLRHEESALWSFAPHDVAVLLRLLGPPSEVWCRGGSYLGQDLADLTLLSLAFAGGVDAHVFVSWLHPFKEQRFVVVGDRQMAVFDDTAPWAEKLVLYPHAVKWVGGRVPVADKAAAVPVAVDECEPLRTECEHFVDCVVSRRAPLTDGRSGVQVLRVLAAAEASLVRDGAPVAVGEPVPTARDSAFVHPTATVDRGAHLAVGARVWHYAHVMPEATIGAGTSLGQNAFVGRGVRVGSRVKIQNNVSLYEGVELEDDVFCGPSSVFTNVRRPRAHVERKEEFERTLVRRGATLGANCTVVCGVTIGRHALVAAGAVVTRDVPDHGLVVGVPARLVGWVCECGERLPDFDAGRAACGRCGRRYRGDGERVEAVAAAQEPGPGS